MTSFLDLNQLYELHQLDSSLKGEGLGSIANLWRPHTLVQIFSHAILMVSLVCLI